MHHIIRAIPDEDVKAIHQSIGFDPDCVSRNVTNIFNSNWKELSSTVLCNIKVCKVLNTNALYIIHKFIYVGA